MVNPQKAGGQAEAHKLWSTPSANKARMDCHQSGFVPEADIQHARVNCRGYEEESTLKILTLHTFDAFATKNRNLWNVYNCSSVYHRNIWWNNLKILKW